LIVVGRVHVYYSDWENHWIYALDENLMVKPGWPHEIQINGYLIPTHPVFADLDNDGFLEYITSHYDFSNGLIYAWHLDGTPFLGDSSSSGFFATPPNPAITGYPVIIDIDGSGYQDVVICADIDLMGSYAVERILAYNNEASLLEGFPMAVAAGIGIGAYSFHSPVVGDINKDGYVDMVYPSNNSKLVFTNFENVPYNQFLNSVQMWRYNRQLNGTPSLFDPSTLECGDIDASGGLPNVADLSYLVEYMFKGGPPPPVFVVADVDASGDINVMDLADLIDYLFRDGTLNCL
jgi:hypothetical protein